MTHSVYESESTVEGDSVGHKKDPGFNLLNRRNLRVLENFGTESRLDIEVGFCPILSTLSKGRST